MSVKPQSFLDVNINKRSPYADVTVSAPAADIDVASIKLRNPDFLAPSYSAGLDLRSAVVFSLPTGGAEMLVFSSRFKISPNSMIYMGAGADPDEGAVLIPTPQCVVRLLQMAVTDAPGAGKITLTVNRNRNPTALTVELSGSGDSAADADHSQAFLAGDRLSIFVHAQNAQLTYLTASLVMLI